MGTGIPWALNPLHVIISLSDSFPEGVTFTAKAKRKRPKRHTDPVLDSLRDLLIVHLFGAGVDTKAIRKTAGVQMSRVTQISKVLKKAKKKAIREATKKGGK